MNRRAHFTELIVSLSTVSFLLAGCATSQKEVTVPKPKKISMFILIIRMMKNAKKIL